MGIVFCDYCLDRDRTITARYFLRNDRQLSMRHKRVLDSCAFRDCQDITAPKPIAGQPQNDRLNTMRNLWSSDVRI